MTRKLMLDTNVLARICHATMYRDVQDWFRRLLERGAAAPEILVSVLADYELRRHLLAVNAKESLAHLDTLALSLRYLPVDAEASRRAALMRKDMASSGLSDAALLMAAQAQIEGAVLVSNDRALAGIPGLLVRAWSEVDPEG